MRLHIFALIALAISSPVYAAQVEGAGTATCKNFNELYRGAPKEAGYTFYSWAEGFMSAMDTAALATGHKPRDLAFMEVDAQEEWLRRYCDGHPEKYFSEAVVDLFFSLPDER